MGLSIQAVESGLTGLRKIFGKNCVGAMKPILKAAPKVSQLKYAPELTKISGKVSQKTHNKSGMFLLEKIPKTPIEQLKNYNCEFIPPNVHKFSVAKIGKYSDPSYSQEIISFYDKDSTIINRFIRETNKNDIFIEYSPWNYSSDVSFNFARYKTRKITRMSVGKNKAKQQIETYRGFELTKDNDIPFMPLNNKNAKIISEKNYSLLKMMLQDLI